VGFSIAIQFVFLVFLPFFDRVHPVVHVLVYKVVFWDIVLGSSYCAMLLPLTLITDLTM